MKHTMTKKLKALSRKVLKISKPYYHNQLLFANTIMQSMIKVS